MGVALLNHEDTYGAFPTGGSEPWHDEGTAESLYSKGYGWMVQILPFVEDSNLQNISKGYGAGDRERDLVVRKTPVPLYFCPSRRQNVVRVIGQSAEDCSQGCALNDYAGSTPANILDPLRLHHDPWFWQGVTHGRVSPTQRVRYRSAFYDVNYLGIITRTYATPPCEVRKVTDGLSNTMAIGEKRVYINRYELGDWHDDIGWTDGWDPDIMRYTGYPPGPDVEQKRRTPRGWGYHFGAAHPGAFNAVFADGHVTQIRYEIDLAVFNNLGNREDGEISTDDAF